MLKTTAVRLTLVYTLLFGVLAVGVVAYLSHNTGQLIISQIQTTVDEEVASIARFSRRGGVRRLIPMIERRARRPGANLYLVSDPAGRIIAGNVRDLDRQLLEKDGWRIPPFDYLGFDESDESSKAIARVFTLPGGLRLLVGRDIGDAQRFREIIRRASTVSLAIMVLTGLLLWFIVGRRALRHIDSVAVAGKQIVAGDLSQRLPLSGSGDEFDRLSNNLNEIISRVEKLNTGVNSMSDSIAHDLKTPLTRLRNRAEVALGSKVTKKGQEAALNEIILDADGLIKTFDALLMISQVDSGARSVQLGKLDLEPIVRDVHELFEPSADEANVSMKIEVVGPVFCNCNRELIAQALTNLLDNAIKYGSDRADAEIDIELVKQKDQAIIRVADNGPGIAMEDRERAVDRFVRLDKSRSKPGSGLGLALVNAVVKLHGGEFKLLDNDPGMIAEIRLPLSD